MKAGTGVERQAGARCPSDKPVGKRNYLVFSFALLALGVAITVVQYKVPPVLEPLMVQFDLNIGEASWLMSIFTAVGIFLSLPTGTLSKRLGPKRVLLLGCAVIVVGSIVGALAGSARLLVLSRGIEGVAFVFVTVAAPLAIERFVPAANRGTANGIWSLWICFGSVIGSTVTPLVFRSLGLSATWIAYAAVVVVAALVFAAVTRSLGSRTGDEEEVDWEEPEGNKGDAASVAMDGQAAQGGQTGLGGYRALVNTRSLLYFFAYLVFNIEILAILSYTPTMLQGCGMDASLSGFAASLPGLLAAVSSPLFGKVIDRTGRTKPFYVVALVVSAPATFLMLTQAGVLLWVGALAIGLVGYAIPVCTLSSLPQIAGSGELLPTAMGLLMLVQCLGEFLGSLLTPLLLGPTGADWVFCGLVICAIGLAGAVSLAFVRMK